MNSVLTIGVVFCVEDAEMAAVLVLTSLAVSVVII